MEFTLPLRTIYEVPIKMMIQEFRAVIGIESQEVDGEGFFYVIKLL